MHTHPRFDDLGRPIGNEQQYTIDIFYEISRFRQYHKAYQNPDVAEYLQQEYISMVLEQMVAHFEVEATAVQMFVAHYVQLITDPNLSPRFKYHPLNFLRQMDTEEYKGYVYCLYGFANDMFKLFQSHRLYNDRGILIASYQALAGDVLYLIVRAEVPDVFQY
jgi:hypothetical protein